jgi:membrane associated rhomboid family serine protease
MLIPLGWTGSRVERVPLVSIVLLSGWSLAFLASWVLPGTQAQPIDAEVRPAVEFWRAHPELELPESLAQRLPLAVLRMPDPTAASNPAAAGERFALQTHLDALGAQATIGLEDSLWWAWGFLPRRGVFQAGLITSWWLHFGWVPLGIALFFFLSSAPLLEDRWSRPVFALFCLVSGALGNVLTLVLTSYPDRVVVGSSGLVSSILGATAFRFADRPAKLLWVLWRPVAQEAPGWFWAAPWLFLAVVQFRLGWISTVEWQTEIGLWCFGFLVAFVLQASGWEQRFIIPRLVETGAVPPGSLGRPSIAGHRADYRPALLVASLLAFAWLAPDWLAPPPPRPLAPRLGRLTVSSSPPGATIFVDGRTTGQTTPATLTGFRSNQSVLVTVKQYGFSSMPDRQSILVGDRETQVDFVLRAARQLVLRTEPTDARAYLDGQALGRTPVVLPPLAPGQSANIRVDKEGFLPQQQTLLAESETATLAEIRLRPARYIRVETDPTDASVFVDGYFTGLTPLERLAVPKQGEFDLRIEKAGYRTLHPSTPSNARALHFRLAQAQLLDLPLSSSERARAQGISQDRRRLKQALAAATEQQNRAEDLVGKVEADVYTTAGQRIRAQNQRDTAVQAVQTIRKELRQAEESLEDLRNEVLRRLEAAQRVVPYDP